MLDVGHATIPARPAAARTRPVGGPAFDWGVTGLNAFLAFGLFLDTWAHVHVPGLETFFTPWHAVLYAGFALVSLALLATVVVDQARGASWTEAVPAGYGWSVVGVPLFLLGGVGDLLWHTFLGIEVGIEASLSPTHLLLALSMVLLFAGPYRAATQRASARARTDRGSPWLAVIALALILAVISSFLDHANPFAFTSLAAPFDPRPELAATDPETAAALGDLVAGLGIAGLLLQSALLAGAAATLVRRGLAPFGSLTLLVTLPVAAVAVAYAALLSTGPLPLVAAALLAGVVADLLRRRLRPAPGRGGSCRAVAFLLPALAAASHVAAVALRDGIWWSVPTWSGAIVVSGVAGLLVSFLVVPPGGPETGSPAVEAPATVNAHA